MGPVTPTIDPIAPWPLVALAAAAIAGLSLWAYRLRLRGSAGAWRWLALGLRMVAIGLCVLAALRPSLLVLRKDRQKSVIPVLTDTSASMQMGDATAGTRIEAARAAANEARKVAGKLGPNLSFRFLRFDADVRDDPGGDTAPPRGRQTAAGNAMAEAAKGQAGARVAALILLSDGGSNSGRDPRVVAQQLRNQQVPVIAVPFGTASGGAASRDLAVRDLVAGPTVYVKNELEVSGTLRSRGFAGQKVKVDLYVEGHSGPVQTAEVQVPERDGEFPIRGLKWTPTTPGEKQIRLVVQNQPGELITTNNEFRSYVTVLKGGLNVLYLQGPNWSWDTKFLPRALDAAEKIQLTLKVYREPPGAELDPDLAPGAYDVYLIGDLPAGSLSPTQRQRLVEAVRRGAGLILLGGRTAFGEGGWGSTELADILPVTIGPGDGQREPEGGIKVVPNAIGLDSFVLKLAPTRSESARVWQAMRPIPGANRFGGVKPGALLLAQGSDGEPIMVAQPVVGRGRVLCFAGETWPWARDDADEARLAYLRFWRQGILWAAHKEDEGDNQVRVTLDRRRVALGGRVEVVGSARDPKGELIRDARFEATVTRQDVPDAAPERFDLFPQGDDARNSYFARKAPGEYSVSVKATRNNQELGTASIRFLVFDDDREMDNPGAEPALLKQVAEISGGKFLLPEQLGAYLRGLDKEIVAEYTTQREVRLWDNWPFLLIFAAVLTIEWWLRKRHGWV